MVDFGNIEMNDFDLDGFDIEESFFENRYVKPKFNAINPRNIKYDNAERMAIEIDIDSKGQRVDAIVSGNFIFGDFIEAYITAHNLSVEKMVISTLSMSQDNADSLALLLDNGFVKSLDLIVSAYFFSFERHALIPYIYKALDKDNRFNLAVCGVHTKTCQFKTSDGKYIVIHGSANLRSSGNIEQFTIEENEQLYGFYDKIFKEMIDNYATINKPIRGGRFVENLKMKVMASGSEKQTKGSKIKASTAAQKRSEKIKASKKN